MVLTSLAPAARSGAAAIYVVAQNLVIASETFSGSRVRGRSADRRAVRATGLGRSEAPHPVIVTDLDATAGVVALILIRSHSRVEQLVVAAARRDDHKRSVLAVTRGERVRDNGQIGSETCADRRRMIVDAVASCGVNGRMFGCSVQKRLTGFMSVERGAFVCRGWLRGRVS
jgi:hypothetical protein